MSRAVKSGDLGGHIISQNPEISPEKFFLLTVRQLLTHARTTCFAGCGFVLAMLSYWSRPSEVCAIRFCALILTFLDSVRHMTSQKILSHIALAITNCWLLLDVVQSPILKCVLVTFFKKERSNVTSTPNCGRTDMKWRLMGDTRVF